MGAFDMLRIANTSLGMHQTWLDSLAHNISNANTITSTDEPAFQQQMVVASSREDGGVDVDRIELGDAEGQLQYAPDHPLADEDGMVRAPAMDMSVQMTSLIQAQRGFQASVQVTKTAQDSYSSALQIGRAQ
ncbi:flagellar basal body rod protein FlgC [Nocardioides euryhalodurans]|jgi:flagellar basal-body rod protein FlgC|uniref:Flagellar basal-body rod protein FlgC n=1 Tax=Nocardioides euryhalodurans TaxID=2518370 RepID=A0A4P7GJZ2_9ACTN|nr:flagellar basal body rod C-terminal domain-containing protein [Nocardioides euryhalodurans]QBR92368.1 flagellar basal-body rod protein FlgC [Nocardioides euryhalodurans]